MSSIKVNGIVLRHANYGEAHRMLTLLTPGGLVSTSARSSRKVTSPLMLATELFTTGEYLLNQKDDRYSLTSFQLNENYYPIREDYEKFTHGVYWLNICETAAQPNEDTSRLFKMLALSLAVLAFGDLPNRALTAVFLAQFAMLQGFSPRLDRCARCGKPVESIAGPLRFDAELGGVCCVGCARRGEPLSPAALLWMQEALAKGAFVLAGRRELPPAETPAVADEAFHHFRKHVEQRLDRQITSGKLL